MKHQCGGRISIRRLRTDVAQINTTVSDFKSNAKKILAAAVEVGIEVENIAESGLIDFQ